MPAGPVCPSAAELQRFLLGEVAHQDANTLELHLEQCVPCQQALEGLDRPDGLVQTARVVASRPALVAPAVESLMDRLARLSVSRAAGAHAGDTTAAAEAEPGLHALLAPPQALDEIGRLGPYRILGILGSGGMGVVFRAEDPRLGRLVALKVVRPRLAASATARQRFQREARAAAELRHPAIVPLHEVGQQGDLTYLVYDYVPGPNLAVLLRETQPAADQAAQWVAHIADALDYAHQLGIIHRDVKPANILLDAGNQPLLSDFGVAATKDAGPTLTQEGDIVGTPAYMSPEQARGLTDAVDGRTDVYSLGVVLYEALSGTVPFQGQGASVLHKVIHEEPKPPRGHRPGIPTDLETICLKALAKEPDRRFATAGDLAADLRRYLRHEPIHARRIGPIGRLTRWCRRNPALAVTLVLAVTTVMLVAGVSFRRVVAERNRAERLAAGLALDQGIGLCEKDEIAQGLLWMVKALELTPAQDEDLRGAILANLGAWQQQVVRPRSMLPLPPKTELLATSKDGKLVVLAADKTAQVLDVAAGRILGTAVLGGAAISAAAISPDHQFLVTGDRGGAVRFWDVSTGQPRGEPICHEGGVHSVTFEPQGQWILVGGFQHVQRYDLATRKTLGGRYLDTGVHGASLSPDGKTVLTGQAETVRRWTAATGAPQAPPLRHDQPWRDVHFSPQGRYIVVSTVVGITHVWNAATGAPLLKVPKVANVARGFAIDPQEQRIAIPMDDNTVRLWNLETTEPIGPPLAHKGYVTSLAFSPRGDVLATTCTDRTAQLWEVATGKRLAPPLHHPDWVEQVAFAPDGRTLLTLDQGNTARLWDVDPDWNRVRVLSHPHRVWCAAFSPDGASLLTGCGSVAGIAQLWNRRSGQPVGPALPHAARVSVAAFSPDGKTCVTGDFDQKSQLCFWDADHRLVAAVPAENSVAALAWSPDGNWLVTGNQVDNYAQQWDAQTRRPTAVRFLHDRQVRCVVFSADSKVLLTGSYDQTARLWDAVSGAPRSEPLANPGQVGAVDLSADGRWVVTGNDDRVACLWDTRTGKQVVAPLQHQGTVRAVAFHPQAHWVLTGSWDRTARLWDRATGKPVGPPLRHDGEIEVARFSPDGRTILTAGWDKVARLWPTPSTVSGSNEQLKLWIEVSTAMELHESGVFRLLSATTWDQRHQRLQQLGGPPG